MKKLGTIILLPLCLICGAASRRDFGSVKLGGMRMPIYNKDQLQAIAYCEKSTRAGADFQLHNVKIDIIKRQYDLDKIRRVDKAVLYKLGAPQKEIDEFWQRFPHSDGIITSPSANIDQTTRKVNGTEKIILRSPYLDLNGIGFDASFVTKKIKIHQNVVMVIKGKKADTKSSPIKDSKIPMGRSDVKITADQMTIDLEHNFVVVTGHVTVDDKQATLTCDKITLHLKQKPQEKTKRKTTVAIKASDSNADILKKSGGNRELDRIVCEKNVVATRKQTKAEEQKNGLQRAYADKAVYNFADESITLTGNNPRIVSGTDSVIGKKITIWRNSERMLVERNCQVSTVVKDNGRYKPASLANKRSVVTCERVDADLSKNLIGLTGNVKLNDPVVDVSCDNVNIKLGEKTGPAESGIVKNSIGGVQAKKEIKEITCLGDVKMSRKVVSSGPYVQQKASANKAVFDLKKNVIALSGNNPQIVRGEDSLRGDKIDVNLAEERLKTKGNSRIAINTQSRQGKGKTSGQKKIQSIMTSDNADLDYGGNRLEFQGNVDLKDPRMKLQCDKLEIFLLSSGKNEKKARNVSLLQQDPKLDSNKKIDKIVCTGNVKAAETRGTVDCQYMELRFVDRTGKKVQGEDSLMSSGGREVSQVICRDSVHMVLKKQKTDSGKSAEKADKSDDPMKQPLGEIIVDCDKANLNLIKDYSELIGNVKVDESRAKLECDKMEIYTKPAAPGSKPAEYEDGEVPERISLGQGKELEKIICRKHVIITRREVDADTGRKRSQKVSGGLAVYDVKKQNVVMSEDEPRVSDGNNSVRADKIFLFLDTGEVKFHNPKVEEMNLKRLLK